MERKHIEEVAKMVRNFLKENGGFDNGYDTKMEHSFTPRSHSHPTWWTPKCEDMTRREMNVVGSAFEKKVHLYMLDNNLTETISVYSVHSEHGAYNIFVTYRPEPVRL